jgi:hypothetical protein
MSKHGMSSLQASLVKRRGHQKEEEFNSRFGVEDYEINFSGSSADNIIAKNSSLFQALCAKFHIHECDLLDVSLKSGNTIQIHLGSIPELTNKTLLGVHTQRNQPTMVTHGVTFSKQESVLKTKDFWNKYLKKGRILCYHGEREYSFFDMKEVIEFITSNCHWRILETGRLKGDFMHDGRRKQFLTYEYRSKKKQFVLGAHGGKKGKEFISLLKENIKSYGVEL